MATCINTIPDTRIYSCIYAITDDPFPEIQEWAVYNTVQWTIHIIDFANSLKLAKINSALW